MESAQAELTFLVFFLEQKREDGVLSLALFGCDRLRVGIERHTDRRVTQQLLHDLPFRASRSKQR